MKGCAAFLSLLCLLLPALAVAGNKEPAIYLEAYSSAEIPTSPAPSYICTHGEQTGTFHCFDSKAPRSFVYVVVHIDKLDATCPNTPGPACANYGGYLGLSFGIQISGEPAVFTCVFPCPGFMPGPSLAGWPAAVLVCSIGGPEYGCRDRWDNPCYLGFYNNSDAAGATFFDIVASADDSPPTLQIINCASQYDPGTTVACNAQWGGERTASCLALVPVQTTSWGRIKQMFR